MTAFRLAFYLFIGVAAGLWGVWFGVRKLLRDYHFSFLGPAGAHETSGNAAKLKTLKSDLGYRLGITAEGVDTPTEAAHGHG